MHCHWDNYMKLDHRPWTLDEDVLLLETVRRVGLGDWSAVARVFNDDTARNRAQCRQRFEGIYKFFKRQPERALENLVNLDTNRNAAKRRERAFRSLDAKFRDWITKMDEEPVVSNIPVPAVNLDEDTALPPPNGSVVKNRVLSKFIRHCQTLLPVVEPRPLAPLPPPRFRRLPDQTDPLHFTPLNLDKLKKRRRGGGSRGRGSGRRKSLKGEAAPVSRKETQVRSLMDREIGRFFRPSYLSKPGRYLVQHSEEELGLLNLAARNLDGLLDFSSLKSNLNPEKFEKFNASEKQVLDNYWFQSDISVAEPQPKARSRKRTYSRRLTEEDNEEEEEVEAETAKLDLIMPNKSSMMALRGCLLHADYTAELAWPAETDPAAELGRNNRANINRVLRQGVRNPDVVRRVKVGNTLFTPVSEAQVT